MKDEFIIINKTSIQKRIEETIKYANEAYEEDVNDESTQHSCSATIQTLKDVLSQSTPLIPEIEKAFGLGASNNAIGEPLLSDYISNLKLDI